MKRILLLGLFGLVTSLHGASFVMRFDDNKPVSQWREVAEIFESIDARCSFAVNAVWLSEEQWAALRDLSARGHEIMDHTAQHSVFQLRYATAAAAEACRGKDFFDHAEQDGRHVLCKPELDLAHPGNVRVTATMTNGVLRSDDPAFLRAQSFSRKFHVPSTGKSYGLGKDCGGGLFKKGPEQKCSDFWGRWTADSFGPCEIVLLTDAAVQPSLDLLRAQAALTRALFVAHGLPPPKTWIRPGGWETGVDWTRMKAVYGDEFGYAVADSTLAQGMPQGAPWCRPSDFAFFDNTPDVDTVYGKVAKSVADGRSFAYISHQWTQDRATFLERCRAFAARLKAGGIRLTTYAHIAESDAAAPDVSAWTFSPFSWRLDEATKTFRTYSGVGGGFGGFAVDEKAARGARVHVTARVTAQRAPTNTWSTLGVALHDNADNFWHASLVQAPQPPLGDGARFFELSEMRGRVWNAQFEDRLVQTRNRYANWNYGETYEFTLDSAPEGISASAKNARGEVVWECAFAFPKSAAKTVTCGRPALHVTGGLCGRVAVREATSAEPRSAAAKAVAVIPPYASDSFVPGVTDKATGFFRVVQKEDGRWWTIDPLGRGMALFGVDHITYFGHYSARTKELAHLKVNKVLFPNKADWETNTLARLKAWGFNLLGAGSDEALQHRGLVHTIFLSMGDSMCQDNVDPDFYICPNEHRPCSAFPNVFHPQFAAWADYQAKERCAPNKADPWLFGYFIDNELAWWGRDRQDTGLFDYVATLPETHSARQAQKAFLAARGSAGEVSAAVKLDFLRLVADTYFRVTSAAIRRHDPNHLVLGARFAGIDGAHPAVWEVAGRYCDVVTFNCYPWADLDRNEVRLDSRAQARRVADAFMERAALVKRPMLITEWSFPALDSGLPCTGGAGQRFRTQAQRTRATELFARTMLALPCLLGYDYFMWVDQPAAGMSDDFPEDSNYGLITEKGVAYPEITSMFARLQRDVAAVRAAGLPAVRPAAPGAKGETAAAFAARAGLTGGAAYTREGDRYVIRNAAGLVLEGRVGGDMMFDRVTLKGKPFGTYTGMSYTGDGWRNAGRVIAADWREEAGRGVLRVTCEARLSAKRVLRQTHDLAVWRDRPWFLCTFVSAQNVGEEPIELQYLYFREYASSTADLVKRSARKIVPNLWKAAARDAWFRASDGAYYGGLTFASTMQYFYYALQDGGRSQHPDATFMPHTAPLTGPLVLAPHATYDAQGTIWMLAVCGLDGEAGWEQIARKFEPHD